MQNVFQDEDELWTTADQEILKGFEERRVRFEGGDCFALFEAIGMCASFQAVMPEWLADEVLKMERDIDTDQPVDFNKRLGWKPERRVSRLNLHLRKQLGSEIVAQLVKGRLEGESLNRGDDSMFERIGKALDVPRRTVMDVYDSNKWIKTVEKGQQGNIAWGDIVIPRERRKGRPIL